MGYVINGDATFYLNLIDNRFYFSAEINTAIYNTSLDDENLNFSDQSEQILRFCNDQLTKHHDRGDYAEFLKLIVIFLGGTPSTGISFRAPGAFHHARWMAKAIYTLKIYLFRGQFQLTSRELNGIRDVCSFLVRLYVRAWFSAPIAAIAPNFDFNFLLSCHNYCTIDKDISSVSVQKMCGHLWYLSEEAVGLSFFDANISNDVKERMVQSFRGTNTVDNDHCHNRNVIQPKYVPTFTTKAIDYFVTKKTASFFKRFNISTEFMDYEPSIWPQQDSYIQGLEIVRKILVVNDVSERKVKLMEEFNKILTTDEEQKQFLLLTVDLYRKKFASHTKKSLSSK